MQVQVESIETLSRTFVSASRARELISRGASVPLDGQGRHMKPEVVVVCGRTTELRYFGGKPAGVPIRAYKIDTTYVSSDGGVVPEACCRTNELCQDSDDKCGFCPNRPRKIS